MELTTLLKSIDAQTARAFVTAARHLIDALLIEARRRQALHTPEPRDYETAALPRAAASDGWLTHEELRQAAQRMGEAMAVERWVDGVLAALRLLSALGGALK